MVAMHISTVGVAYVVVRVGGQYARFLFVNEDVLDVSFPGVNLIPHLSVSSRVALALFVTVIGIHEKSSGSEVVVRVMLIVVVQSFNAVWVDIEVIVDVGQGVSVQIVVDRETEYEVEDE
jgi:hypothetical protein